MPESKPSRAAPASVAAPGCREAAPLAWILKITSMLVLVAACLWKAGAGGLPSPVPVWLAQGLALLGAVVQIGHGGLLRRTGMAEGSAGQLLHSRGLYPWIRHPMYLGELLLACGLLLLAPGALPLLAWAVHLPATWACARAEDRQLAVRYGDQHAGWRARSGLLLPQLQRRRSSSATISE